MCTSVVADVPREKVYMITYRAHINPSVLTIIIICYVVFIAFNTNHSSILPLMALNSLYCADVLFHI